MKRYLLCKCCFCILGLIFLFLLAGYPPEASVPEASGETVIASGVVDWIEEKENGFAQRQLILSLHSVTFCNGTIPNEKNQIASESSRRKERVEGILCYLKAGEETPLIGERIVVAGEAESFQRQRNPGGFDAALYYQTKGLLFYLQKGEIVKRGGQHAGYRQALFWCRQYLLQKLEEICGEDSAVMQAMLLGNKAFLEDDIKKLYQKGGISHILAISGLHISFLGMGLYRLLKKLRFAVPAAAGLSGGILASYVIMTGCSASACRAGMMFLFGIAADTLGRSYERMTALSVSALVLAAWRPLVLYQSGFLLSYGAILGLELIHPILAGLWENRVCRLFSAGISISVITLPVILSTFYELPVYSFFLNLLVIPLMSVVMALGLTALLAGLFFVPLGKLVFFPVHLILLVFQACCRLISFLPGHMWITGEPSPVRIVLYCMLIALFCLIGKYMTKPCALLILSSAVWILTNPLWIGDTVTMLDVGQGDGIVIRSREGTAVLIDGGSTSEKNLAEYTLLPYLKSQGIRKLQYVFLTHMDADHISGVEELIQNGRMEQIRIGTLVLPALLEPDETYLRVAAEAQEAGISVCVMGAGDGLQAGSLKFYCLHPDRETVYSDRNEASLVLYLEKGEFSALFTGDLDGDAEEAFAETYLPPYGEITLLKAGHHGSEASCGRLLLEKCSPAVTLVSCGEKNSYGHPDHETLNRIQESGSRVYVTKDTGAVRVWIGKEKIKIETWLLPGSS